ncbi:hypothetical protein CC78DRAFT_479929, partial [Lojkania enalia]
CADVKKVLRNPSIAVQAARMMLRTGLLGKFQAVVSTVQEHAIMWTRVYC